MTEHIKGITCCGDCAHFDHKKRRCKRGFDTRNDRRNHFFDNCDLPDAQPVVHGKWENQYPEDWEQMGTLWYCSNCDTEYDEWGCKPPWRFCPMCGARMDLQE